MDIVGASFDTVADQAQFVTKQGFPFPLLADTGRTLGVAYGACASPSDGFPNRITYLIGPDRKIARAWGKVAPPTHAEEVLAAL